MSVQPLEEQVATLGIEVARLKQQLKTDSDATTPWWKKIAGAFADNPAFEEAMELGHKYRKFLRSHHSGK